MNRLALVVASSFFLIIPCVARQSATSPDQGAANISTELLNRRLQGRQVKIDASQPKPGGRMVDVLEIQKQTDELNALIKSVNVDLANVRKGVLAADLTQKLKRIEKLSKDLRHTFE
jgi:hypothetical protein